MKNYKVLKEKYILRCDSCGERFKSGYGPIHHGDETEHNSYELLLDKKVRWSMKIYNMFKYSISLVPEGFVKYPVLFRIHRK